MMNKIKYLFLLVMINLPFYGNSQIDTIPIFKDLAIALKTPNDVIKLDLSKQKLSSLPLEIYQFVNLKELYLGKNKFESIPVEISKFTNLEIIDFSKNKITDLPSELFDCLKLKKIIVNQNDISVVPPAIRKLKALEYLDMWSCDIGNLPEEIKECTNLKEIDLRVIEMTKEEQDRIKLLLPKVKVNFSPYCSCSR